ncbi:hypothetical protein LPB137_05920 [Poseidonibacter parvus]|uniref:Solute-binding protein family 3/N-terminal domain-containing protein n=1 Tax=Poseidonibacter parvus TaxID=1850254 RepID=A0A1P8KLK9_9BACT|nr:PhnD/SsuA/transferrin family substrate-binding protein [Poseidonibacter parvus]APW65416.1 hypothetical protein LPB137_05920 [Poseidonibacter parvus]
MKIIKLIVSLVLFYNVSFAKEFLNVGYDLSNTTMLSKKDMKVATDILLKKLLENLDIQSSFIYYYNPLEIQKDIDTSKLDYITVTPLRVVKYLDLDSLEKAFGQGSNNMKEYNLILISRSELNIDNDKELADKKILMNTKNELHTLYIDYIFLKNIGNQKAKLHYSRSYQRSILDLFFKKADVAIVTQKSYDIAIELNPQIAKKVSIFKKTNISDAQLGFFRKGLDEKIKKSMRNATDNINSTVKGKQLLSLYKTEKIVETDLNLLKPIRELVNKFNKLKKVKGIK